VQAYWPALARAFETGCATEDDFAATVIERFELSLAPVEFLTEFQRAAVGFLDGALRLVAEIRVRHRVLSLSNTNPVQWRKVLADLGARDPFHDHHPSHLTGFHKPDPRVYELVSQRIAAPGPIHFFDDRLENVRAAQLFGWQAQRVRGVAEARAACARAGLL